MLGLGNSIVKGGAGAKTIVTDNLVLKHNYSRSQVHQVSTGAADINADAAANEYIDVGTIEITTNDVSVCAWVYITDWVNYGGIFANRHVSSPNQGFELRCANGAQKFQILIDEATDGSESLLSSTKNSNQWYHVCAVMDRSSTVSLYVDGVADGTPVDITDQADSLTHATVAKIGQNYAATEMRGYVCNVGYWNRVLTQAEVKSIMWKDYSGLTSSEKTSMVSWWNLDTAYDSNDGTKEIVLDNHYAGNASSEGSELITNGNFGTGDLTGWSVGAAGDGITPAYVNVNGTAGVRIASVSGGNSYIHQDVLTSGKFYNISYTILENNNGTLALEDDTSEAIPSTVGDHSLKYYFVDSDTSFVLKRGTASATDIVVTNISVKEINGNTGILS
jgi:hypothetical protein